MASTNNALNNTSLNPSGVTGNNQTFTVINSDNSGTSSAAFQIQVGGSTTTGDPGIRHTISGSTIWSTGCDNSASDQFVTCSSNTLGTSNQHTITTGGLNAWINQPVCPIVQQTALSLNRTGAGAVFTIGSASSYFPIFSKGNLGGTLNLGVVTMDATFISGALMISGMVTLTGCTIADSIEIRIVTSNRTYSKKINRPADSLDLAANIHAICDVDASDTLSLAVVSTGEAGNTNDVVGSTATVRTLFSLYTMG